MGFCRYLDYWGTRFRDYHRGRIIVEVGYYVRLPDGTQSTEPGAMVYRYYRWAEDPDVGDVWKVHKYVTANEPWEK